MDSLDDSTWFMFRFAGFSLIVAVLTLILETKVYSYFNNLFLSIIIYFVFAWIMSNIVLKLFMRIVAVDYWKNIILMMTLNVAFLVNDYAERLELTSEIIEQIIFIIIIVSHLILVAVANKRLGEN